MSARSASLVVATLIGLCASCSPDATQEYAGPCRAEWSVYKVVVVAGKKYATPFEVGSPRTMHFTYDETGALASIADDQDGDGVIDSHREVELVGAYGTQGQRLWSRCQGVCTYDDYGNMLSDRDPSGGDTLRYFYDCWQ